jgi:hypothetical protein
MMELSAEGSREAPPGGEEMKKSLLAIALALVMTPFVFAAPAKGANSGQPGATTRTKVKKNKKVKHHSKAKHAPAATAAIQK